MKSALLQILRLVVVLSAASGGIYSLVLARASALVLQDTAVSVAAAVHLQPRNSDYLDRLANWQPDNRKSLLERSLAENRFNDDAWIRLGFLAEMQDGDSASAEKFYLQAAQVDHMFLPRWTLANFYFRQQKQDEFFHWTKETLLVTPYASDPVFAQMWQMTQNEDVLNAVIPDQPRALLQYAWYLANDKKYGSIPHTVERLVHAVDKSDASKWGRDDLLAVSLDHMLSSGDEPSARAVWSILHKAGWIGQAIPSEDQPLVNEHFQLPSYRHGFDWVFFDNPGTRVEQLPDLEQVRVNFYGDESEKIVLMQQYVTLAPGSLYRLSWQAQSEEITEPSGISWHVHAVPAQGSTELISGDVIGPGKDWEFRAPAAGAAFLLSLEYQRILGTTRARGSLAMRNLSLQRR